MLPNVILNMERALTIEGILEKHNVRAAREQNAAGESSTTRYFCPLRRCQGDKHPHFVVDRSRAVDQYGKPIDFTHHVNKDVVVRYHWRCGHSRIEGYGSMALLSAILGFPSDLGLLSRDQWSRLITAAHDICAVPCTELEPANRNGWLLEYAPADRWSIRIADGFTPEAMRLLSLDGMEGIDTRILVDSMHADFGLWQVEKYCTAGCYPSSDHSVSAFKSYERRAHALFPVFAFCYDAATGLPLADNPEKRTEPWVARIVMPAFVRQPGEDFDWRGDFWTAFGVDDARVAVRDFRSRFSIYGDVVAMECSRITKPDKPKEVTPEEARAQMKVSETDDASADVRYAADIVSAYSTGEKLVTEREQEVTVKDGKGKDKTEIQNVKMEPWEVKLNKCVLMKSPLDAVATYLWLNYPRMRLPKGLHQNNYWHVAWLAHDSMQLNVFENTLLNRIANDTFELFGNERSEIALANVNALRYNYLRLCMLPTSMSEMDMVDSGIGTPHVPHTPTDFFRYYAPTMDELARNMLIVGSDVGAKALMLQKELNGSSELKPFTRQEKSKKKAGQKNYDYVVNLTAAWQMMANNGYCRSLVKGSRNTIGQCYRIDGHFVYELDPDSVMADMRHSLEDYAKDNAQDPEDAEMMMNAMLRCKDLQYSKNITKLPLMAMPRSESYGPELDYFFFRNGAVEITPTAIRFRSYDDLPFLVYRTQVLPWDYQQPFYSNRSPIHIERNKEYVERLKAYEQARRVGELSSSELMAMKQELDDYGIVHQWDIQIRSTEQYDERIIVPSTIRNDKEHNQWLCWWPILRLLRCFSNENWAEEEAGRYTDADRQVLVARMANMMYTIGRSLYRYKGKSQVMPYFLENTVSREGKAEGGSGKSTLVQMMFSFVRGVCNVEAKNMSMGDDFAKNFANFQFHVQDVVHIEDFPKYPIDRLFNYATSKFKIKRLYEEPQEISHDEAPQIVITSNFMVQATDDSTLGRVQFAGMSHYFSRYIPVLNKPGRSFDTIWPDFSFSPLEVDPETRGQVIFTFAKCVQFCMRCELANTRPAVPGSNLLERLSRTEMGDSFYDWFTAFLQKDWIYNVPIAINEIFNEYRRYLDPSKARMEMVSRTKFYENLQKYCAKPAHGVVFMPIKPFLTSSEVSRSRKKVEDGSEKSYLRKGSCWLTRTFIDDKGHVRYARVLSKNAGEGSVTGGAVWFSRRGQEPKDADEFMKMLDAFMLAPDPEPILDENEQPVTEAAYSQWTMLNTEEEAEIIRKAGGIRRPMAIPTSTAVSPATPSINSSVKGGEVTPGSDDLPF